MLVGRFYSKQERRAGRVLLAKLMPKARDLAVGSTMEPTPTCRANIAALTIGNVDTVVIYSVLGGWQADVLLFDGMGGGNVIGTQTWAPVASRAAAEESAVDILSGLISLQDGQISEVEA
jgi:hypothetical protein